MKFSIIIPSYNEEKAINKVIADLRKHLPKKEYDYEIIVINDGSTDQTRQILEKIEDIKIINHPFNQGYGTSLKDGIRAAKNEIIVMLDGDDTYPIEQIPKFLKFTNDYSMVSGARTGNNIQIPFVRRPGKFIINQLANFLIGQKIPDLNCGLRVIKKSNVTEFFYLLPNRFSFTITHLLACLSNGYPVKFIKIDYFKRKGKSSLKPSNFFLFIGLIIRIIMYFNPLKFFLWPGSIIFTLGLIYLLWGIIWQQNISDGAIVATLLGIQIIFLGLLADLIIKMTKYYGDK
jgi:glycosyltransferase involved in cell wall biosynthesis